MIQNGRQAPTSSPGTLQAMLAPDCRVCGLPDADSLLVLER